jgi:hypothetical protein
MLTTQHENKIAEAGKVLTKLDLTAFIKFDASNAGTKDSYTISVLKRGQVTVSAAVGKGYDLGTKLEVLVNRKGNIIIVRPSNNGIACHSNGAGSKSKALSCKSVINYFLDNGIELPARFRAEYDEALQAWVGRKCM